MTKQKGTCCSSPAAMCYWLAASLIAWGVLSLIGIYWRPVHVLCAATTLFAMAIGCVANWLRNGTMRSVAHRSFEDANALSWWCDLLLEKGERASMNTEAVSTTGKPSSRGRLPQRFQPLEVSWLL